MVAGRLLFFAQVLVLFLAPAQLYSQGTPKATGPRNQAPPLFWRGEISQKFLGQPPTIPLYDTDIGMVLQPSSQDQETRLAYEFVASTFSDLVFGNILTSMVDEVSLPFITQVVPSLRAVLSMPMALSFSAAVSKDLNRRSFSIKVNPNGNLPVVMDVTVKNNRGSWQYYEIQGVTMLKSNPSQHRFINRFTVESENWIPYGN